MRSLAGRRTWMSASALLVAALLAPLCSVAAQQGPMAMPVKAVPVHVDTVATEMTAVGNLRSDESVLIRPEIAGRVQTIHFQEGQRVAKGDPLVTLDPAEYQAQLQGSTAELTLDNLSYARLQELYEKNLTSRQNLDEARAKLDASRARQALDQVKLDRTVIRASFDGVVGLRQISPGAYVQPGQDLARLDKVDAIKLDFRIPQLYLPKIRVGQQVAAQVDAYPDQDFQGAIYAIDPAVDEETRTVLVRARLPNDEGLLRPGVFARVRLTLERREGAILVPEQAIVPQGDKSFVFRVVNGKAALTPVTLGQRRPGEVEVTEGLAATDAVVTDGQMKLQDGAPVTVLEPSADQTAREG